MAGLDLGKTSLRIAVSTALVAAAPLCAQSTSAPPDADEIPIALMIDLSSNQTLFVREENRRFVPASITKVMTAFTAFEMLDSGKLMINQRIRVSDATFEEWSGKGSSMFVPRDAMIPVDQLLLGITTISANDGAVVLGEGASGSTANWIKAMNANAQAIGLHDSRFGTPNGWPDQGYTFSTARDLATLAKAILIRHPSKFRRYFGHRGMEFNGITQENHDPISGIVDGADGFKTGFTNQAGYGFLGTAERDGRRLIMVVAGAARESTRDRAAREFIEWGFNAFDSRLLYARNAKVGIARVQDGMLDEVGIAAAGPVRIAVPKNQNANVKISVTYRGPVHAPIAEGEEIAKLRIDVDGLPPTQVPLVATQSVQQANFFTRIGNAFGALLK